MIRTTVLKGSHALSHLEWWITHRLVMVKYELCHLFHGRQKEKNKQKAGKMGFEMPL